MKPVKDKKPFDRKEAFVLIFRRDFGVIVKTSLAMTLFALPALIVFFWCFMEVYLLGKISAENAVELYSIQMRMYLWLIPSVALLSVGAAGGFYVIRRLAWGEHEFFIKEFGRGIKSNAAQSAICGVLFTCFVGALGYAVNILNLNFNLSSTYWMLFVVQVFLSALALIILLFQYSIIAVYSDGMFRIIKNSFALSLMSLPRSVAILLLILLPIFLLLTFGGVYWVYLVAIIFLALVGFGYGVLLFTLHAHSVFDKYINRTDFPDIYKKGLYSPEDGKESES